MTVPLANGVTTIAFDELDRVRLKTSVCDKGTLLPAGKQGTIVLCHGIEAYEVEFPDIQDFFQIKAQDLEKA